MLGIYIDDGRDRTLTVEAVAGLHPRVVFTFRKQRAEKRKELAQLAAGPAARLVQWENNLMVAAKLRADGQALTYQKCDAMEPKLREEALSAILGFVPCDPDPDEPGGEPTAEQEAKN